MHILRTVTSASLLAGLLCFSSVMAHAGTWQVTPSSTDTYQVLSPATPSIVTFGKSNKGLMVLNLSAMGVSAANQQQSNQANRSNTTYTFTWVPSNSTDWPSAYTIKSIENIVYTCSVKDTTATAQVFQGTSPTPVIQVVYPGTNTAIAQAPTATTTTTSGTGYTTKTTVVNTRNSGAHTNGWIRAYGTSTTVETNYTAGYFTANFTQPSAIQIVVTIPNKVIKASLNYSGSSANSAASVTAVLSTIVAGQ